MYPSRSSLLIITINKSLAYLRDLQKGPVVLNSENEGTLTYKKEFLIYEDQEAAIEKLNSDHYILGDLYDDTLIQKYGPGDLPPEGWAERAEESQRLKAWYNEVADFILENLPEGETPPKRLEFASAV